MVAVVSRWLCRFVLKHVYGLVPESEVLTRQTGRGV
jgi:hypothetical protein